LQNKTNVARLDAMDHQSPLPSGFTYLLDNTPQVSKSSINLEKISYLASAYDMIPYLAPKDKIFSI